MKRLWHVTVGSQLGVPYFRCGRCGIILEEKP